MLSGDDLAAGGKKRDSKMFREKMRALSTECPNGMKYSNASKEFTRSEDVIWAERGLWCV